MESKAPPPNSDAFVGKWTNAKWKNEYLLITGENAPALTIRSYSNSDKDPSPRVADIVGSDSFKIRGSQGTGNLLKNGTLLYTDKLFTR